MQASVDYDNYCDDGERKITMNMMLSLMVLALVMTATMILLMVGNDADAMMLMVAC